MLLPVEICEFSRLSALLSAEEVVELLNELFTSFDVLVEEAGAHKVRGGTASRKWRLKSGCRDRKRW